MLRRYGFVTIVILVLLLLTAPAAFASGYVYEDSFGRYGGGSGEFFFPDSITVGPKGAVYVGDENYRVQKFTGEGVFLGSVGSYGSGLGQFTWPTALLVDSTGSLLGADWQGFVQVMSTGLTPLWTWTPGLNAPLQMALDGSGNIYVADYLSNRIVVYDTYYSYLREWAVGSPMGVAVRGDEVYVSSWDSMTIEVFDLSGTPVRSFGSPPDVGNPFNLAFAPDGSLLLTDMGSSTVTRWDADAGSLMEVVAAAGDGPGQLWGAWGLAVAPNGDLYVPDRFEHKVERYAWDDEAPVVTHDYDGEWHSTPVRVQFDFWDEVSGDVWHYVSTDDGASWDLAYYVDIAAPADHSNDGVHVIRYQAVDGVGNWTAEKTVRVKIDTRKPRTAISGVPAGWTRYDVPLLLTPSDVGSGVGGVHWRLDGTVWWTDLPEDGIVTVTEEGDHSFEYYAWDNALPNNVEAVKTATVKIDKTKPMPVASNAITVVRGKTATFKYTLADNLSPTCTVKLVIKKNTTTVKTVLLGIKASPLQVPPRAYAKSLTVKLPVGAYTWTIVAKDLAGNSKTALAKRLTVK
jgi:WD40 repeat protein